jgi:endonuclease YncB( thermonuclease family)
MWLGSCETAEEMSARGWSRHGSALAIPVLHDLSPMSSAAALLCLVIAIGDGDTLTARCGESGSLELLKIRLSAVDAPELGQPHGRLAKEALATMCFQQQAEIKPHAVDRYGRTVADAACGGVDAGQALVTRGHAWVFDRYAKGYGHLYPLQADARAERVGLWADPNPVPPWEWRRPIR